MDFSFDTEQLALRDSVRGLLKDGFERRAGLVDTEPGFDRELWARFADLGLLGLPFAEEIGGSGAGPIEVAIVAQEIGRVLAPEPFIDVVVTAGTLLAVGDAAGRQEYLPGLIAGEILVVTAHQEPNARYGTTAYGVRATNDNGWKLNGVKEPVRHGGVADILLVSAVAEGQTRVFAVPADQPGVKRTSYATPDEAWAARIDLVDAEGTLLASESDLAEAFRRSEVALSAEALGGLETAVTTTVEYLKTRKQFGVTLSKFQALTHRAADLYVSLELVRSVVWWAALALAEGVHPEAPSRAKLQVVEGGRHIAEEAIQLHGGIGMTHEYSIGHYTTRLTQISHTLGDAAFHLQALAARVADHDRVELLS